VKLIQ